MNVVKVGRKSIPGGRTGVEETTFSKSGSYSRQNVDRSVSRPLLSVSVTGCRNSGTCKSVSSFFYSCTCSSLASSSPFSTSFAITQGVYDWPQTFDCFPRISCIIVTWWSGSGGLQAWSRRPTGFLQCFDTVGLVVWPVKIVPEMTYNVLSWTLSFYTTTTTDFLCSKVLVLSIRIWLFSEARAGSRASNNLGDWVRAGCVIEYVIFLHGLA